MQELNKLTLLETGRIMVRSEFASIPVLTKYQEFHGIDAREFELIERVLEGTGRVAKPRCVASNFRPL